MVIKQSVYDIPELEQKISFNEYLTLKGWGDNLFIWGGSPLYNRTIEEYRFYEKTLNRHSFSVEEIIKYPDIQLTVEIECNKDVHRKLQKETEESQKRRNSILEKNGYDYRKYITKV